MRGKGKGGYVRGKEKGRVASKKELLVGDSNQRRHRLAVLLGTHYFYLEN